MVKKMESNTNENWKNKGEKQDPTVSYRNFRLRFKVILVFGRGERECLRAYDRLHFNPSITMRSSSISFAAKKGAIFCDPNIANHEKFEHFSGMGLPG